MYTILHFKLTSPTHTPQIALVHSPWLRFYILNYHPLKHLELHTSMHHVNDSTLETIIPPHIHTPYNTHVHSPCLRFYILNYHPLTHLKLHTFIPHVYDSTS